MSAWYNANGTEAKGTGRSHRLPFAASVLMIFALSALCWALLIAVFIGLRAVL